MVIDCMGNGGYGPASGDSFDLVPYSIMIS